MDGALIVRLFRRWQDWPALCEIRRRQLAEGGILLDREEPLPPPDPNTPVGAYEWDYHRMAEIYLSGAGGFWLAWRGEAALGRVGAQDLGGVAELRHMYVLPEYRRQGVGARLVEALIAHCAARGVRAIELWTAADGPGRRLYARCGFFPTAGLGGEFAQVEARTGRAPNPDEIRMRYE
jgi:GNAT superfamily N-acetyltransferase